MLEIAQKSGLVITEAQSIAVQFAPFMASVNEYAQIIAKIEKENPTETDAKLARQYRLKLVENRGKNGLGAVHSGLKSGLIVRGRLIDNLNNIVENSSKLSELEAESIEKHQERVEAKRIADLAETRRDLLVKYGTDTSYLPLGVMTDEQFDRLLANESLVFTARVEAAEKAELARAEAERLAEEQRLAAIEADRLARIAQAEENERLRKENEAKEALLAKDREDARIAAENAAKEAKAIADKLAKENEAKLKEQARLAQVEQERKDKVAAQRLAEEQRQKDRQSKMFGLGLRWDGQTFLYKDINFHWTDLLCMTDAEFDKNYQGATKRMVVLKDEEAKQAEKERINNEGIAAELKAKQDAEDLRIAADKARIEQDESDRLAKEKAAKNAGDKEKINALYLAIKGIAIPEFSSKEAIGIGAHIKLTIDTMLMHIKTESQKLK